MKTNRGWYYRLRRDVHLTSTLELADGVTYDLNGFTLTSAPDLSVVVDLVGEGARLVNGEIDCRGGNRIAVLVSANNALVSELGISNVNQRIDNGYSRGTGIRAQGVSDLLVYGCRIHNICYPNDQFVENFVGRGMYLSDCSRVTIFKNTLSQILNTGIDYTRSEKVTLIDNHISDTALKYEASPNTAFLGDSITAYHNGLSGDADYTLINNHSRRSMNHGIHVSGQRIYAHGNDIAEFRASGLFVGDQRDPMDYSKNVVLTNNSVDISDSRNGRAIQVDNFSSPTLSLNNNKIDPGAVLLRP